LQTARNELDSSATTHQRLHDFRLVLPREIRERLGYGQFSGFQLKIIQEVITLMIFIGFAVVFLKERFAWNYLAAFVCLGGTAFFAFAFKASGAAA
jgi:uncharacterized protein (DUF486 family)